ncbi:MAG: hypothetical protein KGJ77_09845 [Acidobacteriota bacterium]|nr:hypothetical protein [Acidobacteriota bacterium]
MRRRIPVGRLVGATVLASAAAAGLAPAAHADSGGAGGTGGTGSEVVGETVTAAAYPVQFGFDIPGLIPLPNQNIVEADVPFARTSVSSGPTVDSRAAPYYPGDILASLGGLESEFLPPQLPNTPWPFMADAQYPSTASAPPSSTFGPTPPPGLPVSPMALSGVAHASQGGGDAAGTVTDLVVGPGMGTGGAPMLEVASEQATDTVTIGTATVQAAAGSVLKTIEIAGMVDISELTSNARSSSDGTTGSPQASVHLGQVTVDGQQAYIDNQGVHVVGNGSPNSGVPTVAQVQSSLNATLAQDGVTIRLVDPQQTVSGAEGAANTGGLVVSISHAFNVPFVNTGALTNNALQPCIPTQDVTGPLGSQGLGNFCLPAGNYTAVTSITLGYADSDVNANVIQGLDGLGTSLGGLDNGLPASGTTPGAGLASLGQTSLGNVTGPGTGGSGSPAGGRSAFRFPIRGIPAPVGWVIVGALLCVLFAYPMMLAARWQFLVGRR